MATLIVFEATSRQRELKTAMLLLGYKDRLTTPQCGTLYLPTFTLIHESKTPENCKEDLIVTCKKLGIDLQRCIAMVFEKHSAICGEMFD